MFPFSAIIICFEHTCACLWCTQTLTSVGTYPEVELLGHRVYASLALVDLPSRSQVCTGFHLPAIACKISSCFTVSSLIDFLSPLHFSHSNGDIIVSHWAFNLHFAGMNNVDQLFVLFVQLDILACEVSFQVFRFLKENVSYYFVSSSLYFLIISITIYSANIL